MKPLTQLSDATFGAIDTVATDIDDTLTTDGRLTAAAYTALERLQQAGVRVVPITGRPAGWCDHIARMWPVDAVVGENGAFYFAYDRQHRRLTQRFRDDAPTRRANRLRLDAIEAQILRAVPGCAPASDQAYRSADIAIDFCEDVPRLSESAIDQIVQIMRAAGMVAKVSSIHVNGWFGRYDKLGMTKTLFTEHFSTVLDDVRERVLFVGDSPNDAPMFDYFPHSIGVANVANFQDRIQHLPKFITTARAGAGFVEVAERVLAARVRLTAP